MIETILVIGVIVLVVSLALAGFALAFIHAATSAQEPPLPKPRYFLHNNEVIDRRDNSVVEVARTREGAIAAMNRWNEREAA